MLHKVSKKLCASCKYRARKDSFLVYRCDYAGIEDKCRLDPPGMCSHYEVNENYIPDEEWNRLAYQREYNKKHSAKNKKSSRPVGRPKKGEL